MQANPLWPVNVRFPKLDRDLSVDVAVMGGGMAGMASAYDLNKAGYKVVLLEQDEVGGAASGASSGVLYYGSGTNYVPAVRHFGKEKAELLWHETAQAIDEIVHLAETNPIECGLRICGSIMVAKTESEMLELEEERVRLQSIGISTKLLSSDEVKDFIPLRPFVGGISFDAVAQVHPAQFVSGLANIHGPQICENSPVTGWQDGDGRVTLETPNGKVTCSQLIIATNNQPWFGLEDHFEVESSVILASQATSRVSEAFPQEKIVWTMEEKYDILYPRGDRLILEIYGLGDENEKLAYYYPGIEFKIDQQWGDVWAKTVDWMPIAGKVSPNISVAIGMGDQGIVMSWVTSRNIVNVLEDMSNWFTEMSSPRRFR